MNKTTLTRLALAIGAASIAAVCGTTIYLIAKMSEADARVSRERKLTIEKLLELPNLGTLFQLYEVIGERALVVDDRGYWVVQVGSQLPDGSILVRIGETSIETSFGEVIELTK